MPLVTGPNGNAVFVTNENQLYTKAITHSLNHHTNVDHGRSYCATFSQSPTAADDCIFYLGNDSDNYNIVVEGFDIGFIDATAADDPEVYFKINDTGTRNSGSAITPVNLNGGSGNTADCTAEQGADLDGGAATLTGGSEFMRLMFANTSDVSSTYYNFEQDLILPKSKTLTIWANDAGATYYFNVQFYFHGNDV